MVFKNKTFHILGSNLLSLEGLLPDRLGNESNSVFLKYHIHFKLYIYVTTAMNSNKGKLVKHGTASREHPPRRERVAPQNTWEKKQLPKLRITKFCFQKVFFFLLNFNYSVHSMCPNLKQC